MTFSIIRGGPPDVIDEASVDKRVCGRYRSIKSTPDGIMQNQVHKAAVGRIDLNAFNKVGQVTGIEAGIFLHAHSILSPAAQLKITESDVARRTPKCQRTDYLCSLAGHSSNGNGAGCCSVNFGVN